MKFIIALVTLLSSLQVFAVTDLIVRESLTVYKKRSTRSKVVTTLLRGDKVVVSPEVYGKWRKVLVTYDGKRKPGYVQIRKIQTSVIKERLEGEINELLLDQSVGGQFSFFYSFQPARSFPVQGFTDPAKINDQSGFSTNIGAHYQYPWRKGILLKGYLDNKTIKLQGRGEIVPDVPIDMKIDYTLITLGAMAKFYNNHNSFFWKGAGIEIGSISGVSVQAGPGAVLYGGKVPMPIIATGSLGWDYKVSNDIYITPEIRASALLSESPMILSIELMVDVSYLLRRK